MTTELFCHPKERHMRKHGPRGYIDYSNYKPWLRDEFCFRCVYCLERERWYPDRAASFSADHVIPQSKAPDRICDYTNLVYACTRCNSLRQDIMLVDPTEEGFGTHIAFGADALFEGLTPEGWEIIDILRLNKPPALHVRQQFLRICELYASYPENSAVNALYTNAFGFPDELPDLRVLKPPEGNTLPDGASACFFVLLETGTLPICY